MRVYTFKDLTHELRVTMEHELTTDNQDGDKSFHGLIEIIQFAENVTAKIHGLHDESEIFRVVIEEFDKSDHYIATILLTTDDGSSLKLLQTSLSSHNLTAMEKAAGVFRDSYRIDLNKSNIFSQVVLEGKTIVANGPEILGELFPRPLATGLVKLMGLGSQPSVLTPLYLHGNTIGVLSLSTPEHVEYFAASARNLAQHISIALELANEHTERKQIEQWFKESEEKYNTLLSTTGIPITYFINPATKSSL